MHKKFLIVHLVSNGDCLMMTAVAKQIKIDYPESNLTWAISYKCKQVIVNNPNIDQIWEVIYKDDESPYSDVWYKVKEEAEQRKKNGEFDEIIYSQIFPDNIHHFDGTTRSSTFRAFKDKIRDVTPKIRLKEEEIENVTKFAVKNELDKYKHVVLCECTPSSGQSMMTLPLMLELTENIAPRLENSIFIISTHLKVSTKHPNIIDGSQLTFRENAELSKYCTFLIGCSSGISWLLTSNWAKKIKTLQLIKSTEIPFKFASVAYDFEYWGLPTDHILESSESDKHKLEQIIYEAITDFNLAKIHYNQKLKLSLNALKIFIRAYYSPESIKSLKNTLFCINSFCRRNNVSIGKYSVFLLIANKIYKRGYQSIKRKLFKPTFINTNN